MSEPLDPSMDSADSQPVTAERLLQRIAQPFFLFSIALTALLGVSHSVLLPHLTSVEAGGQERSPAELRAYVANLESEITAAERNRNALILPMQSSPFRAFIDTKHETPSLLALTDAVREIARTAAPDAPGAIRVDRIRYSTDDRMLILSGDVRDVGPRSMTVLAQFTEELRTLPFAEDVRPPRFARLEDPTIGFHSPFTIAIALQ